MQRFYIMLICAKIGFALHAVLDAEPEYRLKKENERLLRYYPLTEEGNRAYN